MTAAAATNRPIRMPHRQQGIALITGMLILLVLTVLGVASMRMGTLQERMTHNLRESTIALNGAESAALDGERWIHEQVVDHGGTPAAQGGCGGPCGSPVRVWRRGIPRNTPAWLHANGRALAHAGDMSLIPTPPHYAIEALPFNPAASGGSLTVGQSALPHAGQQYFRVTAVSAGENDRTQVLLQTIYATRF